ncbi:hypothetical protein [Thermomonospora catenispora]|uniref:hypothetical protein n=1 Tax=Thermomonospora catenispora TaxID=2493090 RepID=UPI0013757373|nr:hypothetical protein [Thermomonospora catenispora]
MTGSRSGRKERAWRIGALAAGAPSPFHDPGSAGLDAAAPRAAGAAGGGREAAVRDR